MNGNADRIRGQMINGLLGVKATIAGLHLRMIADTGAALTIITPENAEKIATFAPAVRPRRFAFLGATREMNLPVFQLPAVRVGMFQVEGMHAGVMTLPRQFSVDGVLGVDFLGRFRPTFEFDTSSLVLRPIPSKSR